ncbi:hypothetical protein [Actinokineospora sp. UTMC 2448]|uniref:hypothetical protein n=1 Tax=Actinokineospora sp. UTMC 2448 TaxID=2268449 RepID=UPI0021640464|nr:hypothetical protein [Actinokineospora sp. UTMC 2448]UVS78414.1 hypothetical protein Actkin_02147 [Actinokineospora sp. UTMC 2448]
MSTTEDLTWRFELRLSNRERWVPITAKIAGDEYDGCAEHVGTKEMPGIWQDAAEAAPEELGRVLPLLAETVDRLGMTGARIVVWEGLCAKGDPACVLEATADQLAIGRLEHTNPLVQKALQDVTRRIWTAKTHATSADPGTCRGRGRVAGCLCRRPYPARTPNG